MFHLLPYAMKRCLRHARDMCGPQATGIGTATATYGRRVAGNVTALASTTIHVAGWNATVAGLTNAVVGTATVRWETVTAMVSPTSVIVIETVMVCPIG